jgi:hypothetical protein
MYIISLELNKVITFLGSEPCRSASLSAACRFSSSAILRSNSDLPGQVAGVPTAACLVVDGPYAATTSAPVARFIQCCTTS